MNSIIRAFSLAWLAYFLLLALLPVRYVSVEFPEALAVLIIYVVVSVACTLAGGAADQASLDSGMQPTPRVARPLSSGELDHIVLVGLLASGIGIALIAYVRLSVQGIDYSQGLAVARSLWRDEGEDRGGVSSPLSIPGYGLGFFFLASTLLGHLHWEQLSRRARRALILASVALVAGYSVLTGGRSILLLQLTSVMSAAVIRAAEGKKAFPGKFWRAFLVGAVCVAGALSYILYVFSARAGASGVTPELYAQSVIDYMGGSPTQGFLAISSWPEPLAAVAHLSVIAGGYLTHSAGTLASVMEYSSHHGVTTFAGLQELLSRLGLLPFSEESWILSGAFLSLPGAFWYEYAMWGVIMAAACGGASLAIVSRFIRRGVGGGISMGFSAATLMTAILSPLIFAPDSLAFPFMLLGYLGLAAYSRVVFGPRNWWKVGHCCLLADVESIEFRPRWTVHES